MNIDLFGNDAFPTTFDQSKLKQNMQNVYHSLPLDGEKFLQQLSKLYVLFEEAYNKGGYDGRYMFLVSGKQDANDRGADFSCILSHYNIPHLINGYTLRIPTKNITIEFATYQDVVKGIFDGMDADVIISALNYETETHNSLATIEPKLSSCLSVHGVIYGFLTNPISSGSLSDSIDGTMRFGIGATIEVYINGNWRTLKP